MKSITKYQEFLTKAILVDQTHLISELLDKNSLDQQCRIYNQLEYRGNLSNGDFWATEDMLWTKKDEIMKEIDKLNIARETDVVLDHKELSTSMDQLKSDLKELKEMKARKRIIYQWLLIPHWLGTELISMGEVVFRAFGCSWYGVSSLLEDHCSKDDVLLELIEEMDKSNNILN